ALKDNCDHAGRVPIRRVIKQIKKTEPIAAIARYLLCLFYHLTISAVFASVAAIRSSGFSLKRRPRCPAFTVIYSNMRALSSIKTGYFFFVPRGEQPPLT